MPEIYPVTHYINSMTPKKLFFSYSKSDRDMLHEFLAHLSPLKRRGKIQPWSDRDLLPGEEWDKTIREEMAAADVILLLISAQALNTDYIYDVEIKAAMARHEQGTARVIPIILRPCQWNDTPFAKLNGLPTKGKPVSTYENRDLAWLEVVKGIERVL